MLLRLRTVWLATSPPAFTLSPYLLALLPSTSPCAGGGAGAYFKKPCIVTPGETYTITVGAGGAGGSSFAQSGQAGGTSSFGNLLSATGGGGGGGAGTGADGAPGTPGTASGGISGRGSESFFGFGTINKNGAGYGNGGAGGSPSSIQGGNGAPGFCIIEW